MIPCIVPVLSALLVFKAGAGVCCVKPEQMHEARLLRRQGQSIRDIADKLKVSKGSVSAWVREIRLTPEQIERLDERMRLTRAHFGYISRCGGANTNKAEAELRHKVFTEAGFEKAKVDDQFRILCALYWGEGRKKSRSGFEIANSDPLFLKIILAWLISAGYADCLAFRVQYYAENGLSEEDIKAWWYQQLPRLEERHWRKITRCGLNRASQRKKIGTLPYGTATLTVCRTELFFMVMGGIKYLQQMGDW